MQSLLAGVAPALDLCLSVLEAIGSDQRPEERESIRERQRPRDTDVTSRASEQLAHIPARQARID